MTEASFLHFNNKCWDLNLYELHRVPQELIVDDVEIAICSSRQLNNELMCPICLDMLKNTMTTKECLHRFCQDCIITALRSGNKECPTCRKKLVSKRSLRRDPNFDELIAKLYPYREKSDFAKTNTLSHLAEIDHSTTQNHIELSQIEIIFKPYNCLLNPKFLKTTTNATIEHLTKYLSMRASVITNENKGHRKFNIYYLKDGDYVQLEKTLNLSQVNKILCDTHPLTLYFSDDID